jgi:hypothetical protein
MVVGVRSVFVTSPILRGAMTHLNRFGDDTLIAAGAAGLRQRHGQRVVRFATQTLRREPRGSALNERCSTRRAAKYIATGQTKSDCDFEVGARLFDPNRPDRFDHIIAPGRENSVGATAHEVTQVFLKSQV